MYVIMITITKVSMEDAFQIFSIIDHDADVDNKDDYDVACESHIVSG